MSHILDIPTVLQPTESFMWQFHHLVTSVLNIQSAADPICYSYRQVVSLAHTIGLLLSLSLFWASNRLARLPTLNLKPNQYNT